MQWQGDYQNDKCKRHMLVVEYPKTSMWLTNGSFNISQLVPSVQLFDLTNWQKHLAILNSNNLRDNCFSNDACYMSDIQNVYLSVNSVKMTMITINDRNLTLTNIMRASTCHNYFQCRYQIPTLSKTPYEEDLEMKITYCL